MTYIKKLVQWFFGLFGFTIGWKSYVIESEKRKSLEGAVEFLSKTSQSIGFKPLTVIDAGVADGTPELYQNFPDARFLLIEPLEEFKESIENICKQYNAVCKFVAASDKAGMTRMSVTPDLVGSSMMTVYEEALERKEREIPTDTIDNMVNEFKLESPFILKADTQGAELKLLQGAEKTLAETEIVILEVTLFSFTENGAVFSDIVRFMEQHGFVVYDIVGLSYRPLDGALGQIDMVFVKEKGIFRTSHLFASPEQRNRQFSAPDKRY